MVDGTPSSKPEFSPLLEIGRHEMSLAELRQLCVSNFPLSTTRPKIMEGLEKVIDELRKNGIEGEVWINGSFLTEKMNPEDVDLVLRITAEFYENGAEEHRKTVDWLNSNLKDLYSCHSYLLMEWPKGHSQYWIGQYYHSYWMKQFGFSRGNEMKGIAVIALQGGEHD